MHWLWFLIIGAVAGWLAGQIARGHGFGLIGDIVVGIIGALIGGLCLVCSAFTRTGRSDLWSRPRLAPLCCFGSRGS